MQEGGSDPKMIMSVMKIRDWRTCDALTLRPIDGIS